MRSDRKTITVRTSRIGSLAAELFGAESSLLRAESDLEDLLDSLFGSDGWDDFEAARDGLDVYGCIPSPAAVNALRLAGFPVVCCHDHPRTKFLTCACRSNQ